MRRFCLLGLLFSGLTIWAGRLLQADPSTAPGSPLKVSPPYTVKVTLDLKSPFVGDGRMSLAEFSIKAVFSKVTFEFDPEADAILGRCQITADGAKGEIIKIVLNDIQEGDERQKPKFTKGPAKEFTPNLSIQTEDSLEGEEVEPKAGVPPKNVAMVFLAEFWESPTEWGSPLGSNILEDMKVEFKARFSDLLLGKPATITLPYEGAFPEDKGTWRIEFIPAGRSPKIYP